MLLSFIVVIFCATTTTDAQCISPSCKICLANDNCLFKPAIDTDGGACLDRLAPVDHIDSLESWTHWTIDEPNAIQCANFQFDQQVGDIPCFQLSDCEACTSTDGRCTYSFEANTCIASFMKQYMGSDVHIADKLEQCPTQRPTRQPTSSPSASPPAASQSAASPPSSTVVQSPSVPKSSDSSAVLPVEPKSPEQKKTSVFPIVIICLVILSLITGIALIYRKRKRRVEKSGLTTIVDADLSSSDRLYHVYNDESLASLEADDFAAEASF